MGEVKKITVAEVARLAGGELRGEGSGLVAGVASLEEARSEAVSFLGNPRFREQALKSGAGVLIVSEALPLDTPQVIVSDPYGAFVRVMNFFHPPEQATPGVHPSAVVEPGAVLGEGVQVGPLAMVGEGARVGERSVIGAGTVVGKDCEIGSESVIHAGVTLYPRTRVGSRVIIHSGTVIGSDGFGFILSEQGHVKKPQVGIVVIEDDVEIGANCAIDRAMLDATVVGAGTKLDNLVHLAHNVRVGRHCIILASTAVGGSTRIGDHCLISGKVAVKDNITLGDRVNVVGGSAVMDDVPAGETVFGYPAQPFSHAKRVYSRLKQLPDLFSRVRSLEKKSGGRDD